MECLPSDIILDILSRLPVESVLDCKLVCKSLLNLLNRRQDQFSKMHHGRQLLQLASSGDASSYYSSSSTGLLFSFNQISEKDKRNRLRLYYGVKYNDDMNIHENFSYKTLQKTSVSFPRMLDFIVGSCHGLICLNKFHHGILDPIHICNPNTGEYVNLPEYTLLEENYVYAVGFGYIQSMENIQYKVVRILYPESDNYEIGEVQVYTIGSGRGWRTIGTTSSYMNFPANYVGVFVNGALHWFDAINIVVFDLANEEFRLIQSNPCDGLPPCESIEREFVLLSSK